MGRTYQTYAELNPEPVNRRHSCPPLLTLCPSIYQSLFSEVAQSCPTLCNPMDCSLIGSFIHGIFQTRIPEWVAISFQEIFLTQGLNLGLPHCRHTLYHLSHLGSPLWPSGISLPSSLLIKQLYQNCSKISKNVIIFLPDTVPLGLL